HPDVPGRFALCRQRLRPGGHAAGGGCAAASAGRRSAKRVGQARPALRTALDPAAPGRGLERIAAMTRRTGFLHWMLPAMLGLVALTTLLSGRDLSQLFAELQAGADIVRHPIVAWAQRGVSILLLVISAERIISHIVLRKHLPSTVL